MIETNRQDLALIATVLLVVAAIFIAIGQIVNTVTLPEDAPEFYTTALVAVQTFFSYTGVALVVVLVKNFFGYTQRYYEAQFSQEEIEYSTAKLKETVAKIVPVMLIVSTSIEQVLPGWGAPIGAVVAFIASFMM